MKIDTAGNYTLRYTATDSCGNSSSVDRPLTVASPRTVLYTDGTFIINESPKDKEANEALHGAATNEYIPFNAEGLPGTSMYGFTSETQRPWHNQYRNIKSVEIGSNIKPTFTAHWFEDFFNATSFNVEKLDTSNVESMSDMFNYCSAVTSLDVSNFNTSKVTNMNSMFKECNALTSLDLSNFNTSNVTDMGQMFYRCIDLTSLNVTSFDTGNVKKMEEMFYSCRSLQSLNVLNFNTSKVNSFKYMFGMCSALANLDVSSFNTNSVTDIGNMFSGCSALQKIYASTDFVTSQVTSSRNMFSDMSTNLIGGAGTTWSSSNPTDKTYARIDNPPDAPGYFTLKPTA